MPKARFTLTRIKKPLHKHSLEQFARIIRVSVKRA